MSVRESLDEAFLRRLDRLRLLARRRVAQGRAGEHPAMRRGSGIEPASHRAYAPGDDFRRIDWNAFRRFERLYVTEREEETERTVVLVLDRSGSMALSGKLDLARGLVAALAHVALHEGDAVRLVAFAGGTASTSEPRRGRAAIYPVLRFLDELEPGGTTGIASACRLATRGPRRPGLAVLVTDFLDPAPAREALLALASGGRNVLLVHVTSPEDEAPSLEGARRLRDVESGEELVLTLDDRARAEYAQAFLAFSRRLRASARSLAASYVSVRSDQPLEAAALAVLETSGVVR